MRFSCKFETDKAVMAGVWLEFAKFYDWPRELHYIPEAAKPDTWAAWVADHGWLWLFYSIPDGRLGGYAMVAPVCEECGWMHFGRLPWVPVTAAVRAGREWLEQVYGPCAPLVTYSTTKSARAAHFAAMLGFEQEQRSEVFYGWWRKSKCAEGSPSDSSSEAGERAGAGGPGSGAPTPAPALQPREHIPCAHADCGQWQNPVGTVIHAYRKTTC